jgi:hypothetical protein
MKGEYSYHQIFLLKIVKLAILKAKFGDEKDFLMRQL